jgi:hypothetical protein
MSIAVNSLTGPYVESPATFSKSALSPPLPWSLSVFYRRCCLHMATSKVPHNHNFKKEVEYSEAFQYFLGSKLVCRDSSPCSSAALPVSISFHCRYGARGGYLLGHWWLRKFRRCEVAANRSVSGSRRPLGNLNVPRAHWWRAGVCSFLQHLGDGAFSTVGNLITSIVFFPMALMDLKEKCRGTSSAFWSSGDERSVYCTILSGKWIGKAELWGARLGRSLG